MNGNTGSEEKEVNEVAVNGDSSETLSDVVSDVNHINLEEEEEEKRLKKMLKIYIFTCTCSFLQGL